MRFKNAFSVFIAIVLSLCNNVIVGQYSFPENFKFGVATSAYQIEGGWNADGKGLNIWDKYVHEYPNKIEDHSNADVTCDSYHKLEDDIKMLVELGVNFYRFSLSWSRILPNGYATKINEAGIEYYNRLINELLEHDIEPFVTIHHWDLPQPLQEIGGWPNPLMVEYFVEYADVVFQMFGDRVQMWLTFNEPKQICLNGYGEGIYAPGYNQSGHVDYLCTHTLLKSHAAVYHLYDKKYRTKQKGIISITIDSTWYEPGSIDPRDIEAHVRGMDFTTGWYANPVYNGDYPEVMRERIDARSELEGYPHSRLPKFTKEEVEYIKGTYDFFALNAYSTNMVNHTNEAPIGKTTFDNDMSILTWKRDSWPGSAFQGFRIVPWGFRKLLHWIKLKYRDPDIIITENGYPDFGELDDEYRVYYYRNYLKELLKAMHEDGVKVKAYTAWSLMDNYEWNLGYTVKFGLYKVDFNDPNRKRTPKKSAYFYKKVISERTVA